MPKTPAATVVAGDTWAGASDCCATAANGATASTAGLIPFPVLAVSVSTILGSVLVLALLVGSATRRRTA